MAELYNLYKKDGYKITDKTTINFKTLYDSTIASDLTRGINWKRTVYQLGKLFIETQQYEGVNAEQVPYEEGYAVYEILVSVDDEKTQFLAMELKKLFD